MDNQRQKAITALKYGRYSGDSVVWAWWWWLRSPGNNTHNAANVNNDGNLNMNGNNVSFAEGGVRPALPHKPEIRFKAERIRAEAKESDSLLSVRAEKHRLAGAWTRERTCFQALRAWPGSVCTRCKFRFV